MPEIAIIAYPQAALTLAVLDGDKEPIRYQCWEPELINQIKDILTNIEEIPTKIMLFGPEQYISNIQNKLENSFDILVESNSV